MFRWLPFTALLLASAWLPAIGQAQSYPSSADDGVFQAGWKSGYTGNPAYGPPAYGPPGPIPAGPGQTRYVELPDDKGFGYEGSPLERTLVETFRHAYFRADYLLWSISDPGAVWLGARNGAGGFAAPQPNGLAGTDPTQPFSTTVPNGPFNQPAFTAVPTLSSVSTNNNNGIRGIFAVPFKGATFEASVFGLANNRATIPFPEKIYLDTNGLVAANSVNTNPLVQVPGPTVDMRALPVSVIPGNPDAYGSNRVDVAATPVLVNGQPSAAGTFLFWDPWVQVLPGAATPTLVPNAPAAFTATLNSQVWGTEGNWVIDPVDPGAAIRLSPTIGFRYLTFNEDLRQSGTWNFVTLDPNLGTPTIFNLTRQINASAINNLYGPQIGFRSEFGSKWVTFGAAPKVMLGFNTYKAALQTSGITATSGVDANNNAIAIPDSQSLLHRETTFGIVGDLQVYSSLNLSQNFSLRVGYDLLWAGLVTRPANDIVYNIRQNPLGGQSSGFSIKPEYPGLLLQGLSIGGELRY